MKQSLQMFVIAMAIILNLASCSNKKEKIAANKEITAPERFLPFQSLDLASLSAFKETTKNWVIAGNAYADRSQEANLIPNAGKGVLLNLPKEGMNQNLFTTFEHGDIELELEVMMPLHSNSGIYFQGRYEVQLFDSWGIEPATFSDMGGIYERWDSTQEKGMEGSEGRAPILNAAKAPGLWQHFKIIFHAPKFDTSGTKIKNAWFESIGLNGILIQENVELTGPTRAAAFNDETPKGPLMIQGDHGSVAFKNIKYKLYDNNTILFEDLKLQEFENTDKKVPSLDSLVPIMESITDSISPIGIAYDNSQRILKYSGKLNLPKSGDYLFEMKVNGGAVLLLRKDTLINLNGEYNFDSLGLAKISLEKGTVPFTLIYNKHTPWMRGFELYAEGPAMQRFSLQKPVSLPEKNENPDDFTINVIDGPVAQRSFWMHKGAKRTHCISVGMPQGIHYTYDLEAGSLLQLWQGEFMDARQMWESRGEKQLGAPKGFIVSLYGDPEFAFLENDQSPWPTYVPLNPDFKPLGYAYDAAGIPSFLNQLGSTKITSRFLPLDNERTMNRTIQLKGDTEIWHKIADGASIELLPDGSYIINDESYFIHFSKNNTLKPSIRNHNGKDELLLKIPSGKQRIDYNITW